MRRVHRRAGFSLLEAMIAVGIFVASMAFIGQLLDVGIRLADQGKERTQALLRCESMMEEIVAGIRPIAMDSSATEKDDPVDRRWKSVVSAEETKVSGLLRVTVTVKFFEDPESMGDEEPRVVESLTRLVVDRTPPTTIPVKEGSRGECDFADLDGD
jgi:type II secretory pathway pseudopilin PulG